VSKRLRVFEDPVLAPAVLHDELSVSAAEELLSVSPQDRRELLARAVAERWDRAQVRNSIRRRRTARRSRPWAQVVRRVRELRRELRGLPLEELRDNDRRELRLLFQDLSMLARARPGAARVFPPLPRR
jgi:hypothetical protein